MVGEGGGDVSDDDVSNVFAVGDSVMAKREVGASVLYYKWTAATIDAVHVQAAGVSYDVKYDDDGVIDDYIGADLIQHLCDYESDDASEEEGEEEDTTRTKCPHMIKRGKWCRRFADRGKTYCHQHAHREQRGEEEEEEQEAGLDSDEEDGEDAAATESKASPARPPGKATRSTPKRTPSATTVDEAPILGQKQPRRKAGATNAKKTKKAKTKAKNADTNGSFEASDYPHLPPGFGGSSH